jgi:uncharacterized protein YbcI
MAEAAADPLAVAATPGAANVAISNAMVQIQREYLGRGPTKVRTSLRDNTIVVLMEDTLTRAERSLVNDGKTELVLHTRASFQGTMKNDMIAAVEQITGRRVVAFMSTNHVDPDVACEILVLAPDTDTEEPLGTPDVIADA